jgi:thioredoxin 1
MQVIRFTADWCGPCKKYAPVFNEFSEKISSAEFFTVDADEQPDVFKKYAVTSVPTTLIIIGGREVFRVLGPQTTAQLEELVGKAHAVANRQ